MATSTSPSGCVRSCQVFWTGTAVAIDLSHPPRRRSRRTPGRSIRARSAWPQPLCPQSLDHGRHGHDRCPRGHGRVRARDRAQKSELPLPQRGERPRPGRRPEPRLPAGQRRAQPGARSSAPTRRRSRSPTWTRGSASTCRSGTSSGSTSSTSRSATSASPTTMGCPRTRCFGRTPPRRPPSRSPPSWPSWWSASRSAFLGRQARHGVGPDDHGGVARRLLGARVPAGGAAPVRVRPGPPGASCRSARSAAT